MPKGSGLGTSSILAATLLGTLGELCGLNWDHAEICRRTLTLEQMLTTGGGWQDQIGGIARGLKLIETQPGLNQDLVVRWLPDSSVRGRRPQSCHAAVLHGHHARGQEHLGRDRARHVLEQRPAPGHARPNSASTRWHTYEVLLRGDWRGLCECIAPQLAAQPAARRRAPIRPRCRSILDRVQDDLAASKLLGAGGGGYMLMLAKDPEAAVRIRGALDRSPPNAKARFVEFDVSATGLEITRS